MHAILSLIYVYVDAVCMFPRVSCVAFTDDSSMLAAGFENSQIVIWSLSPQKLRAMKSVDDLAEIDKEAGLLVFSLIFVHSAVF